MCTTMSESATTHSSSSEALDNVVSLSLSPVHMNHFHIETVIDQLVKQLLGTLFALDKHQQWRSGPLGTHRERKIGRDIGTYCTV